MKGFEKNQGGECTKNKVVNPQLTTKIVTSYARHPTVGADQVSELITQYTEPLVSLDSVFSPLRVRSGKRGYTESQCGSYIFMERAELHETLAIG